jgi:predicted TIM-barrel fold metal-dependent hydrolase
MKDEIPAKIDTHAHYLPPGYLQAAQDAFPGGPDGLPGLPAWSVESALESMAELNISSSVLSVSSPGVHFGDDGAARWLARTVNDAGARLVLDHSSRFGLFASLPLPDVEGSLFEIEYAFESLDADGVVLMTNARGIYLGDSAFDPIFEELNRRQAVVFMHPTSAFCPTCHGSGLDFPSAMLEFLFDSTRAVTNLILSGTLARNPGIRLIVPHAGAMLPVLAERIVAVASGLRFDSSSRRAEILSTLRSLYYDLAGFPLPTMLRALTDISEPTRILYGSDWPFTPQHAAMRLSEDLDATDLIDGDWRAQIYRDNALELLPRLKGRSAD